MIAFTIISLTGCSNDNTEEKTKEAIEALRPKVIKFSEKNYIISNNKEIEANSGFAAVTIIFFIINSFFSPLMWDKSG